MVHSFIQNGSLIGSIIMTSSITIHKMHNKLNQKIRDLAKQENISINKLVKSLLEKQLGISKDSKEKNKNLHEFKDLCGAWSEDEFNTFNKSINDLNTINSDDWK